MFCEVGGQLLNTAHIAMKKGFQKHLGTVQIMEMGKNPNKMELQSRVQQPQAPSVLLHLERNGVRAKANL